MEVSKKDWKLFRACIGEWQEAYMAVSYTHLTLPTT